MLSHIKRRAQTPKLAAYIDEPMARITLHRVVAVGAVLVAVFCWAVVPVVVAQPATVPICKSVSIAKDVVEGLNLVACDRFNESGSAIRVPADTSTRRYGALQVLQTGADTELIDRTGKRWPIPAHLVPVGVASPHVFAQMVVSVNFTASVATSVTPFVYVSTGAMVAPFAGKQFVGNLTNMTPPNGVPAKGWVLWEFTRNPPKAGLAGRFLNLTNPIKEGRVCHRSLVGRDAPKASSNWYSDRIGSNSGLNLSWSPAMHGPGDSEIVADLASGPSYMDRGPSLPELLKRNVDTAKQWTFMIHGNPMGSVMSFTGRFVDRKAWPPC